MLKEVELINLTGITTVDDQVKLMTAAYADYSDAVTAAIDRMGKPELNHFAHACMRLLAETKLNEIGADN
jgi:hypothetical protein